jgi:hypothetical protein
MIVSTIDLSTPKKFSKILVQSTCKEIIKMLESIIETNQVAP